MNQTPATTATAALDEIAAQDRDFDRMIIQKLEHQIESAEMSWESAEEAGDTATAMIWETRLMDLTMSLEDAYRSAKMLGR